MSDETRSFSSRPQNFYAVASTPRKFDMAKTIKTYTVLFETLESIAS